KTFGVLFWVPRHAFREPARRHPDIRESPRGAGAPGRPDGGRQAPAGGVARGLPARRRAHQVLRIEARRRPGAGRHPGRGNAQGFHARPEVNEADFESWSREVANRMQTVLAELLPASRIAPARLHDAMRYSTLGGGKRVRAMLVFAAGEVTAADSRRLDVV